ncbi:hypothetical protein CRUP_003058 [Coryphaenoides rupestris]|nr:hypothetical protein CRUP_003058 [Coryphaenoides rupestris]
MADLWGDYEDGVTEDNCSTDCGITLVENLPEALLLPEARETQTLPLSLGFHHLLDRAQYSVEVVSPVWNLLPWEPTAPHEATAQGQYLFQRLLGLRARGVKLRIASSLTNSTELKTLAEHITSYTHSHPPYHHHHYQHHAHHPHHHHHYQHHAHHPHHHHHYQHHAHPPTTTTNTNTNTTITRKHMYIGSGDMDWRSLSKRKELGVVLVNCSCLALDLNRVFSFYWQLQGRNYIPNIWSSKVIALYGKQEPLQLQLNSSGATAYLPLRTPSVQNIAAGDVEAIQHVIQSAQTFAYISVTDYLPLVNRTYRGAFKLKYADL